MNNQTQKEGKMATNKFNVANTLLPQSTKAVIGDLNQIDNFALKLNKCVNWFKDKTDKTDKTDKEELPSTIPNLQADKFKAFLYKKKYDISTPPNNKNEFLLSINANFNTAFCESIRTKQRENAKILCKDFVIINEGNKEELNANWRLIVGLGNESVYETSMTLHYVYGIPYIPASGIKGVIRNWVVNENFNSQESEALKNTEFVNIFGSGDAEGKVIFFDAFPINLTNESIQPDIMNPHYPKYYDGNKPPADWQSPKPIFFLTLKDTNFEFIFGVKNNANSELLKTLTTPETGWLFRALKEQGIGAKTAVGYGRMYEPEKVKLSFLPENKKKLSKNRQHKAEGIITRIAKDTSYKDVHYASIYIRENDIRENIKVNRLPNKLEIGTIILVENIKVDGNEQFREVSFSGEKRLQ